MSAQLPTLQQLNNMHTDHNILILLRILNTSDMSFMYDIFQASTLQDIVVQAEQMLSITVVCGDETPLTPDEMTEVLGHLEALKEHIHEEQLRNAT